MLLAAIDTAASDKLTGFALRLALAGHRGIPRENEFDFLAEAESVFASPQPKKEPKPRKEKKPTLVKTPATPKPNLHKGKPARKKIAA